MATTKTIQPTGTTITIPAMTDRPDASVYSTDVDRITDAVNSLNSNITAINNLTNYTLDSRIESANLIVNRLGKIVTIHGGVVSKTSSAVTFGNDEDLITGLPSPSTSMRVFMAQTYEDGTRNQYRLKVTAGRIASFWDSVVVPATGYGLYINITYFTNDA